MTWLGTRSIMNAGPGEVRGKPGRKRNHRQRDKEIGGVERLRRLRGPSGRFKFVGRFIVKLAASGAAWMGTGEVRCPVDFPPRGCSDNDRTGPERPGLTEVRS